MKFFTTFLAGLVSVLSIFMLTSCGESGIKKANTTISEIYKIYENREAFNEDYSINFGSIVQAKINSNTEGYVQLKDLYNKIFIISQNYIDNNKDYILNRTEDQLKGASKKAVGTMNSKLGAFKKKLDNFVDERNKFVTYFQESSQAIGSEDADLNHLKVFKQAFGNLVESNLDLSISLANAMETTEIFSRVNSGTPTKIDSEIVKEYVGEKLLPIFSKFKLTEFENKFVFENTQQTGPAKQRIRNLIQVLDADFSLYQNYFVNGSSPDKITAEQMNDIWLRIEDFLNETENYYTALKKFNFFDFAKKNYNLEEYKKSNKFAEIYLEKMEQFLNITFKDFMTYMQNVIV